MTSLFSGSNHSEVRFVTSTRSIESRPNWNLAEVAVAGRSNAGKSSLINAVLGVKNLARTGKTPGRTRSLNFYSVGNRFALVDLPGYGYAKMPKALATELTGLLYKYLETDPRLRLAILVVDSRRSPEEEEVSLIKLLSHRQVPTIIAANKCDKLNRSEHRAALERWGQLETKVMLCSALTGEGINAIRKEISDTLKSLNHSTLHRATP